MRQYSSFTTSDDASVVTASYLWLCVFKHIVMYPAVSAVILVFVYIVLPVIFTLLHKFFKRFTAGDLFLAWNAVATLTCIILMTLTFLPSTGRFHYCEGKIYICYMFQC